MRLQGLSSTVSLLVLSTAAAAPATDLTWAYKTPLLVPVRQMPVAVAPDGKIYGFGGDCTNVVNCAYTQVYDPATDSSALRSPMPTASGGHGAAVSGGKIYVIGGATNYGTVFDQNEAYDPVADTWTSKSPMPTRRYEVGVTATPDGRIWVVGGQTDDPAAGGVRPWFSAMYILNKLEVYDPATDSWATKALLPSYRQMLAAVTLNGKVYAIGGHSIDVADPYADSGLVEEYDPETDSWVGKASLNVPRGALTAVVANGKIYACGGTYFDEVNWRDVPVDTVEEYDPVADTWTVITGLPVPMGGMSAAAPTAGRFYLLGGAAGCSGHGLVDTVLEATIVSETQIASLGPSVFWVGLKNSDDQGTQFDLEVELYRNGSALLASGNLLCVTGLTRNPSLAKQVGIPFGPILDSGLSSGDQLSLRVLTRIGTNPDGTKCSGPGGSHNNAVGLRLYYDAVNRSSQFGAEITPDALRDFYLHGGTTDFLDAMAPTGGTARYRDSAGVNFAGGNQWKEIGTWSMSLP